MARLTADISPFTAKIAEARAELDKLKKNITDTVNIKYDKSALSDLSREAERLSGFSDKHLKIKLDMIDGTRTFAELIAIEHEMDHLNGRTAHVKVDVDQGALSRIKGLLGPSLGSSVSGIPFIGGAASNIPAALSGPALAGLAGAAGALLNEVVALGSGFVAAGVGAGAFAALALPAFKNVSSTLQQVSKDQDALNRATTSKQREAALAHLKDDWKQLDPLQRQAVSGMQKFSASYHSLSKAFEPQAMRVFTGGLRLMNDMLPHLAPFASTFATAMSKPQSAA